MVPAGNKAKYLSSVNHTTKTIHQGLSHNIFANDERYWQLDHKLRFKTYPEKMIWNFKRNIHLNIDNMKRGNGVGRIKKLKNCLIPS